MGSSIRGNQRAALAMVLVWKGMIFLQSQTHGLEGDTDHCPDDQLVQDLTYRSISVDSSDPYENM